MGKKDLDLSKLNVPWITKEGHLDLLQFPINSTLKGVLSEDEDEFRGSCLTLESMIRAGRTEAAVFSYGLLSYYASDLGRKAAVVEALGAAPCMETSNVLFHELTEIKSSNATRGYITIILRCMERFPLDLVREGFEQLLQDKKWSHRMKRKFKKILGIDMDFDMDLYDDDW